jgi:ATP-dependent Lon protease
MAKLKIKAFDNLSFDSIEEDSEFIPLLSSEDEEEIHKEEIPDVLPILPLRNSVLFPGVVIPITAGRDTSIALVKDANKGDKIIGVVAQKNEKVDDPELTDLHQVGTVARIIKLLKMPDGNTTVILQGTKRFQVGEMVQKEPYLKAKSLPFDEDRSAIKDKEFEAIIDSIREKALEIIHLNPALPSEASFAIKNIDSKTFMLNFISSNMDLNANEKQELLDEPNLKERALLTLRKMDAEMQRLELKQDIQSKTRSDMDKQQREYYLHQQLKTIQEELGEVSYHEEIEEMKKRAKSKKWNEEAREKFEKELGRLQRMNPQVAEYSMQRNYLDLLLELPWGEYSKDIFDLKRAQRILERDHSGMEKVKERVIEHLAVLKLKGDMKSPILCLYGPPGVGKTSLGRSIAEALGRKYVRMSLGGLRDEAEIRGHRKTYIGALPGRILQSVKKAGTSNPVFILDEIDKLGSSHQGDPSSAMLEVLDPEQNTSFYDNYLEMGYDLSKVLFIATANNISEVPWALRDRMELIQLTGYTLQEKVEIAKKHLLPKQLKEHGLSEDNIKIGTKELELVIDAYTRESGVRNLEKRIAKLVRYAAKSIAMEDTYEKVLTETKIREILGVTHLGIDKYEIPEVAGVVTGLSWSVNGGDIMYIESIISKGTGMTITGNLGNVMKESATIALEFIKANAKELGVDSRVFDKYKIHIHVPEGAVPKDGPSGGIALLTSLVSVYTQRKVKPHVAMTGEITLRGKVLPIGGVKEKILAAKRANIKELIMCEENRKDVEEINPKYIKSLKFHYVTDMKEVVKIAVLDQKVKHPFQFELEDKK